MRPPPIDERVLRRTEEVVARDGGLSASGARMLIEEVRRLRARVAALEADPERVRSAAYRGYVAARVAEHRRFRDFVLKIQLAAAQHDHGVLGDAAALEAETTRLLHLDRS